MHACVCDYAASRTGPALRSELCRPELVDSHAWVCGCAVFSCCSALVSQPAPAGGRALLGAVDAQLGCLPCLRIPSCACSLKRLLPLQRRRVCPCSQLFCML